MEGIWQGRSIAILTCSRRFKSCSHDNSSLSFFFGSCMQRHAMIQDEIIMLFLKQHPDCKNSEQFSNIPRGECRSWHHACHFLRSLPGSMISWTARKLTLLQMLHSERHCRWSGWQWYDAAWTPYLNTRWVLHAWDRTQEEYKIWHYTLSVNLSMNLETRSKCKNRARAFPSRARAGQIKMGRN